MSEANTPSEGALTVDQAVASLMAPKAEEPAQEAPVEAAEGEAGPQGGDQPPEEADAGAETPAEGEETPPEAEAVAPAEPPAYWSKDAKTRFAELTPEMQAVVLAQESPREEFVAKARTERDDAVKAREARDAEVTRLAEALGSELPKWIANFASKWGETAPDWVAVAAEHGAEAMTLAKAQYEQERNQLVEAKRTQQTAETQARDAHAKAQVEKLKDIAPELMDPVKGPPQIAEVQKYLAANGITDATHPRLTAETVLMAHKAMQWDQAQAKLTAAPKQAPRPPPQRSTARPATSAPQSPPLVSAQNRFNSKPTLDNAVQLLLARKA